MNLKPQYPLGANTTGLILAGLLFAFGSGLVQPVVGMLSGVARAGVTAAAQSAQNVGQ